MNRRIPPKNQLWNVSPLPTVKVEPSAGPPSGPAPRGGSALKRPAVLSFTDQACSPARLATAA